MRRLVSILWISLATTSQAVLVAEWAAESGVVDSAGKIESWQATSAGTLQPVAAPAGQTFPFIGDRRPTLTVGAFPGGQPGITFDGVLGSPISPNADVLLFDDTGFPTYQRWAGTSEQHTISSVIIPHPGLGGNGPETWFGWGTPDRSFFVDGVSMVWGPYRHAHMYVAGSAAGNGGSLGEIGIGNAGLDQPSTLTVQAGQPYVVVASQSSNDLAFTVIDSMGAVSHATVQMPPYPDVITQHPGVLLPDFSTGVYTDNDGSAGFGTSSGVIGGRFDPVQSDALDLGSFDRSIFQGTIGLVRLYDSPFDEAQRTTEAMALAQSFLVPAPQPVRIDEIRLQRVFALEFFGADGAMYTLESTSDLSEPFASTGTKQLGNGQPLFFCDPSTNPTHRFYRIIEQGP